MPWITNGAAKVSTRPTADESASCHGSDQWRSSKSWGPSPGSVHAQAGSVSRPSAVDHHVTATVNVTMPTGSISTKYVAALQLAPSWNGAKSFPSSEPG